MKKPVDIDMLNIAATAPAQKPALPISNERRREIMQKHRDRAKAKKNKPKA